MGTRTWGRNIIIAAIGVFCAAAIVYFGYRLRVSRNKPEQSPLAVTRAVLQQSMQFDVPVGIDGASVPRSQIPQSVEVFLDKWPVERFSATSTKIADQQFGYRIRYDLPLPIETTFRSYVGLASKSGWTVIRGSRANLMAFFEIENERERARIVQEYIDARRHAVEMVVFPR
jgi:hypothetical protein